MLLMSLALGTSPCTAPSVLDVPSLPAGSKAFISSSSLKGDVPYLCFRCLRTWGRRKKYNQVLVYKGRSKPASKGSREETESPQDLSLL